MKEFIINLTKSSYFWGMTGVAASAFIIGIGFGIITMMAKPVDANGPDLVHGSEAETVTKEEIKLPTGEIILETEELETEEKVEVNTEGKPVVPVYNMPYYIRINRSGNCVTIYTKDAAGNYSVPVKAMVCSVGRDGEDTPLGVFKTSAKYTWRLLFGNSYGQYSTRIVGHILFHSVPYKLMDKNTLLEGEYNKLGEKASAGCVRLSVEDAKWIYDHCALGTIVEIFDHENPGPLGKPTSIKVNPNSPFRGWDPTDPDPQNPWKTNKMTMSGAKNLTVERGTNVDLTKDVKANDVDGMPLEVIATGVDLNVAGTYTVTYTATSILGTKITSTAQIVVKDTKAPELTQNGNVTVRKEMSETEIIEAIKNTLTATDLGQSLDKSSIAVDITTLKDAMTNDAYGTYECSAYATDASGNKSDVIKINVVFEETPTEEPDLGDEEDTGDSSDSGDLGDSGDSGEDVDSDDNNGDDGETGNSQSLDNPDESQEE